MIFVYKERWEKEKIQCTVIEMTIEGVTKPQKSVENQSELKTGWLMEYLILTSKAFLSNLDGLNELILLKAVEIQGIY